VVDIQVVEVEEEDIPVVAAAVVVVDMHKLLLPLYQLVVPTAAILDLQDHPVNLDNLEDLATPVPLEHLEILVALTLHPVHQLLHHHANHVLLDHPDPLDHLAPLEMPEAPANQDKVVELLHPDLLDQKDHLANLATLDNLAALDNLANLLNQPLLLQDHLAHLEMLDHPANLDNPEHQEEAVDKDHLDPKDLPDHPAQLVNLETLVNLATLVKLEVLEKRVFARNTAPSTVVSSSRTELAVKLLIIFVLFEHFVRAKHKHSL
jgi:hypothetical protein